MASESWNTLPDDYTKFIWCGQDEIQAAHIHYAAPLPEWKNQEVMCGQDDLVYQIYDDKRPDFIAQNDKIQSSGKYTWFFTYMTVDVETQYSADQLAVDVLACYNRAAKDDVQVRPNRFDASYRGGTFTFADADPKSIDRLVAKLAETKYVFVTWGTDAQVAGGSWCRIVFVVKPTATNVEAKIVVTGRLPTSDENNVDNMRVYIPSGVLYHRRMR
jgi:hypothetical protein